MTAALTVNAVKAPPSMSQAFRLLAGRGRGRAAWVCCQKVSEAEAMVYGGVRDVLVTNEVVGRQKLRRLMGLAHTARIGVCVDDPAQVRDVEADAAEAGVTLPVHVEVNMGGNRCGV